MSRPAFSTCNNVRALICKATLNEATTFEKTFLNRCLRIFVGTWLDNTYHVNLSVEETLNIQNTVSLMSFL